MKLSMFIWILCKYFNHDIKVKYQYLCCCFFVKRIFKYTYETTIVKGSHIIRVLKLERFFSAKMNKGLRLYLNVEARGDCPCTLLNKKR